MNEYHDLKKLSSIHLDIGFLYSISIFFCFLLYDGVGGYYWFSLIVFALIYYASNNLDVKIPINIKLVRSTLLCAAVILFLNVENLSNSLAGDHWYHLASAYQIPFQLLPAINNVFPHAAVSFLLWVYSCLILLLTFFMFFLYKKNKNIYAALLIISGCVFTLFFYMKGIANGDPHPALRLYPMVLLGSLGLNSIVFRLQGLIPLLILIYWALSTPSDNKQRMIFLAFVFTIPVLFFNTFLVEFSIWTFAILTIFFITIVKAPRLSEKQIITFAIAFTLVSLVRQTAAFGLVLLVLYCLLTKNTAIIFKLLIIGLPAFFQLFKSATSGTPATYDPEEMFLNVPQHLDLLGRLIFSMQGQSFDQILSTSGVLSICLVFFLILSLTIDKQYKALTITIISLLLFWIAFHSIRPLLWGIPRYQLEYIAPLVVTGFYLLQTKLKRTWVLIPSFFVIVNIYNVASAYQKIPELKIDFPEYFTGETPYISEHIFNIEEAINGTYDQCNGIYNLGNSISSNLPLVFSGIKVDQFSKLVDATAYKVLSNATTINSNEKLKSNECYLETKSGYVEDSYYNQVRNTSVIVHNIAAKKTE